MIWKRRTEPEDDLPVRVLDDMTALLRSIPLPVEERINLAASCLAVAAGCARTAEANEAAARNGGPTEGEENGH